MTCYYNSQTKFMDNYLTDELKKINEKWKFDVNCTSLWYGDVFHSKGARRIAMRVPGATRGHIEIDKNNIIIDVVFYEDVAFVEDGRTNIGCYNKDIIEASKNIIGQLLDFDGYDDDTRFEK